MDILKVYLLSLQPPEMVATEIGLAPTCNMLFVVALTSLTCPRLNTSSTMELIDWLVMLA